MDSCFASERRLSDEAKIKVQGISVDAGLIDRR